MVDWRKIPKIDAHIHLTPKDVIDANIDYDGRFIVNGSIDDYEKIMKTYNIECFHYAHLMIHICFLWNQQWKQ